MCTHRNADLQSAALRFKAVGFRTVVVKSRVKLELRLNSMIIRGETEKRIFINEINTLIIQSTAVSMTAALLNELTKNNIKVIFCDEKCNPSSELLPYYGAHNTSKRYKQQIMWTQSARDAVWRIIIMRKIIEQSKILWGRGKIKEADMLVEYASQVTDGDTTNREGHAAKVYFNSLFEGGENRRDDTFLNGCLNYGYAILLSAFNREVAASGYMTQLGIWHDNEFNQFNLSSDLMEPFRPYVDRLALSIENGDKDFKIKMADILNYNVTIGGKSTTFDLAVRQYARSVFQALQNGNTEEMLFPEDVEWNREL